MASLRLVSRRIPVKPSLSSRSFASTTEPTSRIRTSAYVTLFALTAGVSAVYYLDSRAAVHRYLITPIIRHALDPETGHKLAVGVLESAGFDKDGRAIDGLFNLGFGWVEVGSVTPKPQSGNPRPRVFHLPEDDALINRYGFPSQGQVSVLSRLRARLPTFPSAADEDSASLRNGRLLAVNLGKNKESPQESPDDFITGVRAFAPHADVLVINVSSPNTPGLRPGIRGLQQRELLSQLLRGVVQARDEVATSPTRRPKLVLKISPDLDSHGLEDIADAVSTVKGIDGVIVTNTTIQRPAHLRNGGLSGAPLQPLALEAVRGLRKRLPAEIPIIGCGGISSGADALAFASAGASFVQLYTAFGYDGAGTCRRIKDELTEELARRGTTWHDVVKQAVSENAAAPRVVGVQQLVRQAEELKGLLDELADRMSNDASAPA
ncbi:Dihydroorotate dehydrogenase-domain-containing protein [Lactarius deliciosus]|nr:Dihydroorotate dehydrogenase-domain-containing protein [Lactarius deliciosus]